MQGNVVACTVRFIKREFYSTFNVTYYYGREGCEFSTRDRDRDPREDGNPFYPYILDGSPLLPLSFESG
jgi:hypothetical protein